MSGLGWIRPSLPRLRIFSTDCHHGFSRRDDFAVADHGRYEPVIVLFPTGLHGRRLAGNNLSDPCDSASRSSPQLVRGYPKIPFQGGSSDFGQVCFREERCEALSRPFEILRACPPAQLTGSREKASRVWSAYIWPPVASFISTIV